MRATFFVCVAAAALALPGVPAHAAEGDIDASWGLVGRVGVAELSGDPVTPQGADHSLVPVSCGEDCGSVVRLDANGRQVETIAPAGTVPFTIYRLIQVPSGVLALGAGAARFTTDGQLDSTFTVAPVAATRWVTAAQRSSDEPIHLGGTHVDQQVCNPTSALLRTFSPTGAPTTGPALPKVSQYDEVTDLAHDSEGNLLVGFHATTILSGVRCTGDHFRYQSFVLGYRQDGSPRREFGYNGVVAVADRSDQGGLGLAVAPSGIVTASGNQLRVLRATDGATTRVIPIGMHARSVMVDRAGRYVVGGDRIAWIRPDGQPDTRFGMCGYSAVAGGYNAVAGRPIQHRANDVLVRAPGSIILRLGGTDVRGAPHRTGFGTWGVQSDGRVHTTGDALWCGPTTSLNLGSPVTGITVMSTRNGYWIGTANGTVRGFGHARHLGDLADRRLNKPIVGIAATPFGDGYWLVASDGGIFSFGEARFHGSTGAMRLNRPIVGMAPTPTGRGYWLVASDGGIFSFGDARFHGSAGNLRLASPIVGMAATGTGGGYHLVAAAGGTFAFGDAVTSGNARCSAVDVGGLPDRRARVFCANGRIHAESFSTPPFGRPIVAGTGA